MLCKLCKSETREKIEAFKAKIKNKLHSIFVTTNNHILDYAVLRKFGFIKYQPRRQKMHTITVFIPLDPFDRGAITFFRNEDLRRRANALANYKKTYFEEVIPHPPLKFKHFDFPTQLDYVPSYHDENYRQLTCTRITIIKAKDLVIRNINSQTLDEIGE
jgi:hypothetical protein